MSDPTIYKSFKNLDLIKISDDKYCVAYNDKTLFGKKRQRYYLMRYNGTDFLYNEVNALTVADFERAEYIFNCNAIMMGKLT